jgi:hypothetical protein
VAVQIIVSGATSRYLTDVHIVFWDLDKTYLRTEFDTVKDLLRTAFEREPIQAR